MEELENYSFAGTAATAARAPPPVQPLLIPLCRKGDRASIERLLQGGASLDEVDVEGNTPLHVAVEAPRNEVATVQLLLAAGMDPNARNQIAATPLHFVCLRRSNQRIIANLLLENGAEVDASTIAGRTTLHFACENQLPELVDCLCINGADCNLQDQELNTPMHLALAKSGGRDTVKRQLLEHLLLHGANPFVHNALGMLPIHLACQTGSIRCLQLLYEHRAEFTTITSAGQGCLHLACRGGFGDVVQWLLQVVPQSVNMMDCEGNTPLHCCALVGGYDCAVLLMRSGADTGLKNAQNKTALDIAKIRGTDLDNTHNAELAEALKDATSKGGCKQQ